MENPYSSPQADTTLPRPAAPAIPGLRRKSWAVGQVRLVAILLLVQGAFEAIFGLIWVGAAIFVVVVFSQPNVKPPPGLDPLQAALVYSALAAVSLVPAGLHIWAGIANLQFRSYGTGLVALGFTALSIFSCFCAPTGFALMIYGLIVYLQPEVPEAFQLGESGQEIEVILQAYR